jgi:4-hydroxybenzoate polyprenyltransferase
LSRPVTLLRDLASILRLHIIAIAIGAALVFGEVLTGELHVAAALLGGLDWLLINLLNRVSDVEEDRANQIRGTERLVGRHRAVLAIWIALLAGSMIVGHLVSPALTPWRAGVQLVGVGYSYRIVPAVLGRGFARGRWVRFKDLYFFKNFMSAALFVCTCLVYPLTVTGGFADGYGWGSFAALVAFFVPFEITYEILYDLRDLEGDRLAGVPTYPVVHGEAVSLAIIDALLVASFVALVAAVATGLLGVREALMGLAPVVQVLFYKPRVRRGLTTRDCIQLTWLGAGLLMLWLVGTRVWAAAGLPLDVWL